MSSAVLDRTLDFLQRSVKSSIGKNVFSLYVLQLANYVLPLITVPHLVRVLGPEKFGTVAFGQGLMAYFVVLVNYGFDWSATRTISIQRGSIHTVERVSSSVWIAKALLCGLGFLVLLGLIPIVPQFEESRFLLLILYGTVVGHVLFPTWLFQGMEQMIAISVIHLLSRVLVTVGIFFLINQPSDFVAYAILLSFSQIVIGVVGVVSGCRLFGISLIWPGWTEIRQAFVRGWPLFLSKGFVNLYTSGNSMILGLITNNAVVGYYSGGEKLVKAAQGLLNPISQAAYPRFSKMAEDSKEHALKWSRRMLFILGGVGLSLSLILFIGAPVIVRILLGEGYEPSVGVVRILSFIPFLVGCSNVFGVQIMLPFGHDRAFTRVLVLAGIISVTLAILLTPLWQQYGMAASMSLTELFVTVTMLIYLTQKGLNPIGKCILSRRHDGD